MLRSTLRILMAFMSLITCLHAQNADVVSERATYDFYYLDMLRGRLALKDAAVWPVPLDWIQANAPNRADFNEWFRSYYGADTATGDRFHVYRYSDSVLLLRMDAAAMVQAGRTGQQQLGPDDFILARPSLRTMGILGGSLGFFLDLSNGQRITGNPFRIAMADPTLGRIRKFVTEEQEFFDRYTGYIQYQSKHLRMRFGRESLAMGVSPIDNFVHSINAQPMDGLLIDVPYGIIRFTSTHSMVDGADTAGNAVRSKFIATHRLSADITQNVSFAVSDMIVYRDRGLDFAYMNPLAFFVSAGLSTEERSNVDNSLMAFEASVRPFRGGLVYGSLLIDDLSYSTLSDTSFRGNNNKFGYQLGATYVVDGVQPTQVTLEYVRLDPFTYSHRTMTSSYTHMGAPVGYDIQPNADRLALQARHWFTPRTFVRFDLDYTRHGENYVDANGNIILGEDPRFPGTQPIYPVGNVGGDILRGDGDFLSGNRFLNGNLSHTRRFALWFSAEVLTNFFTDLRCGYVSRSSGNNPMQFGYASLEIRIGY